MSSDARLNKWRSTTPVHYFAKLQCRDINKKHCVKSKNRLGHSALLWHISTFLYVQVTCYIITHVWHSYTRISTAECQGGSRSLHCMQQSSVRWLPQLPLFSTYTTVGNLNFILSIPAIPTGINKAGRPQFWQQQCVALFDRLVSFLCKPPQAIRKIKYFKGYLFPCYGTKTAATIQINGYACTVLSFFVEDCEKKTVIPD